MSKPASSPVIGVLFFGTDRSLTLLDFARAAEERALDSSLLPSTRVTISAGDAYPAGGYLPDPC